MSTNERGSMTEEPDTGPQDPPQPQAEDSNLARLRELARGGSEAIKEAAALREELALIRSGISAESKLGAVFLKGYDGDRTDPDAMRAAAAELEIPFRDGFAPAEPAPEENGTEIRRALAGEDAAVDDGEDHRHPSQIAEGVHRAVMASGKPRDDAEAAYVASIAGAAAAGDSRVIYRGG